MFWIPNIQHSGLNFEYAAFKIKLCCLSLYIYIYIYHNFLIYIYIYIYIYHRFPMYFLSVVKGPGPGPMPDNLKTGGESLLPKAEPCHWLHVAAGRIMKHKFIKGDPNQAYVDCVCLEGGPEVGCGCPSRTERSHAELKCSPKAPKSVLSVLLVRFCRGGVRIC